MFSKCINMMIQGGHELQRDLRKIKDFIFYFFNLVLSSSHGHIYLHQPCGVTTDANSYSPTTKSLYLDNIRQHIISKPGCTTLTQSGNPKQAETRSAYFASRT